MASLYPAEAIGQAHRLGRFAKGAAANIVALSDDLDVAASGSTATRFLEPPPALCTESEPMQAVDCVVAGAGVVGLAIARAIALSGREVLVVEKADAIGTVTSSRNSEVIHAGIYYAPGSLKSRLCVEGRERLYAYCRDRNIGHARTGKLIVAVEPDSTRPVANDPGQRGTLRRWRPRTADAR